MKTLLAVIIGALAFQTRAAITIDASRVIYSGKDKSASLKINNRSSKNYIVQTRLDTGRRPQQRLTHCGNAAPGSNYAPSNRHNCALFTQEPVFLPTGKVCFG